MKYIMFEVPLGSTMKRKVPIIFPENMVHVDVAEMITGCAGLENAKAISAGFCKVFVECYDKSTTLGLEVDESDDSTINTYDYTHGLL